MSYLTHKVIKVESCLYRASDKLWKKVKYLAISQKFFGAHFAEKCLVQKWPILQEFPGQFSLESNWFGDDLMNAFNEKRR